MLCSSINITPNGCSGRVICKNILAMKTIGNLLFPNTICCDAQRRKRAIGEISAENCSDFDVENLENRRRKRKKSVANQLPRILRSSTRQTNVQMQLLDVPQRQMRRHFQNFRAKSPRFRRRKFEKSTPQTPKISFKNSFAHF